ncbi:MAG TPA: glycosyltransferase family 39 protein, partial [Thermoanaerobaculia bacterium]|nr:glycosyltransferase family 39 protein [Thermoanaerobaculia bacterium]
MRNLGGASLQGDETIFAQVGREAANGALLPLHFEGAPFLHKPPLLPWAIGLSFRLFGFTEFSSRLPAALSGLALVLLVYLAGSVLFSRLTGAVAALTLLTNFNLLFTHGLRRGVADGPLLLFLSAGLLLYLARRTRASAASAVRWSEIALCGALLGLGLYCKSGVALLGVAIVGLFVALFPLPEEGGLLSLRRFRDPLLLTAVALALFLPWLAAMGVATHGEYPRFLVATDLLARATQGIDSTHLHRGVYWRVLKVDFRWKLLLLLPLPLLLAWRQRNGGHRTELARVTFLAIWAAVVLGAFAAAVSRLPWYIAPAYPALALLLGWSVEALYRFLLHLAEASGASGAAGSRKPLAGLLLLLLLGGVGVTLARGLWRSWEAAGEDVARIDAQRIALYLESLGHPGLPNTCIEPRTTMREWNAFYLLPLCRRHVHGPADASGCDFILARSPEAYLSPGELASRARRLSKFDSREEDLWFLSPRHDLPAEILNAPPPPVEVA